MLRFYSAFNLQPLARLCRHCAAIYCIDFDFLSNLKRSSYGIWSEFPIHKPNHTVVTHSDTVFAVVGSRNISFRVHDVVKRVLAVSVESFPSASPTTCDYFFTLSLYKVVLHHLHQSHCESLSAYKSGLCWVTAGLRRHSPALKCPVLTCKEGGEPKYSPHHHNTHLTRDTRKTHTERLLEEVSELVCAGRKVLSRHEAGLFDFACPQIKNPNALFLLSSKLRKRSKSV